MPKRIRVLTKCVADTYSTPNERVIEFSDPDTPASDHDGFGAGGLISFRRTSKEHVFGPDKLVVMVYCEDPNVIVLTTPEQKEREATVQARFKGDDSHE